METPTQTPDVRLFLQAELVRRCQANPKYSLRAFARLLGLESSALSKILNGKRAVSPATLKRIARQLALTPAELQSYQATLAETRGRQKKSPLHTHAAPDYRQVTLDHFQIISDWYHFAILELIAVKDFQPKLAWIARSLGISLAEAQAAVERLQRLEYLEITPQGKWIDRAGEVTNIRTDFTATAMRRFQHQILAKAITALEETPIAARDHTGMTMAIDSSLLPEAREKITRFRRELCAFLQSGRKKNSVYQLGIALYPLTTSSTPGETK
jgi:uncharacterized protein (TIGR02147 family)